MPNPTQKLISFDGIELLLPPTGISWCCRHDDEVKHINSNEYKSVDVIIETDDEFIYIEVKNPDHPNAMKFRNRDKCITDFKAGKLDEDIHKKFMDSFLYEWAESRANKPIKFYLIIGINNLESALLLPRKDALKGKWPFNHPDRPQWTGRCIRCEVFSFETWNSKFPDFKITNV